MNWLRIIAAGLFVLLYLRSPIDLIPDRIGVIGLLDDLLLLLWLVWWVGKLRRPEGRAPRTAPRGQGASEVRWDPYAALGVDRQASREEITRAYREQMKRYHPDRVADLGEELQRVAHQKTVEIQRAYAEIGGD